MARKKLGLAEALRVCDAMGVTADSSDAALLETVRMLTPNQRAELAVAGLRTHLSNAARERTLSVERRVQQERSEALVQRQKEIEAKRGPDWMYRGQSKWNKAKWEEFLALPETHPARVYWADVHNAEQEARDRMWADMQKAAEDFKKALHMEWTAELLAQRIAMPDGTATTWGDATIEQHRERLNMFQQNAVANMEGAARHSQAIEDLERAGASSLYELAGALA